MDREVVEVHEHTQKERGQYPAILTKQASSVRILFCVTTSCGTQRVIPLRWDRGWGGGLVSLLLYNKYWVDTCVDLVNANF